MSSASRLHLLAPLFLAFAIAPLHLHAQASDIPSAQTAAQNGSQTQGVEQDKRGRILLDQMVAALGGELEIERALPVERLVKTRERTGIAIDCLVRGRRA